MRINIQHGPRLLADASGGPFLEGLRSWGDLIHYPFFVGMFHKKTHPAIGDPPLLYPNYDPFTKLVN